MLDIIKAKLLSFYEKTDKIGLFFSLFDSNNNLLLSNGVLTTNKPLPELVEILYHALLEKVEKQTKIIAIDIIKDIQLQPDIQKLLTLSPKEYGIIMINKQTNKSGIILPNTEGIIDIKGALGIIKEKYALSGNVEISTFTTRRIAFQI